MPSEIPETDVSVNVKLEPFELLLLDGKCSAEVQAEVDLVKQARDIAVRHTVPLASGLFVARAMRVAMETGRLTCYLTPMVRCPVTGKRAAQTTPSRVTRDNPFRLPVDVPFPGYELDGRSVGIRHYPRLGISAEGLEQLRPVLAAELMPVPAYIPEKITGRKPLWRREDVVRCKACGWEGREGLTGTVSRRWHTHRACPACGQKQGAHFTATFQTVKDRFEVVDRAAAEAADMWPPKQEKSPPPSTPVSRGHAPHMPG